MYNGTRGHYALSRGRTFPVLGRRGLNVAAISGVDMALWDLLGKSLGVPVVDLWGGACRADMPLYASGGWGPVRDLVVAVARVAEQPARRLEHLGLEVGVGRRRVASRHLAAERRRRLDRERVRADVRRRQRDRLLERPLPRLERLPRRAVDQVEVHVVVARRARGSERRRRPTPAGAPAPARRAPTGRTTARPSTGGRSPPPATRRASARPPCRGSPRS